MGPKRLQLDSRKSFETSLVLSGMRLRTVETHPLEIKALIALAISLDAGEWGAASRSRANGWLIERSLENAGGFWLNNNDESPNNVCYASAEWRRKYTHTQRDG